MKRQYNTGRVDLEDLYLESDSKKDREARQAPDSDTQQHYQYQEVEAVKKELSGIDVPIEELSGDENEEKYCMKSSIAPVALDEQLDANGKPVKQKYTPFYASIQVMKTIVGTGILGLPLVMMNFGLVIGVLLFLIVYGVTQYTCFLLLKCKNLSRHSNYCTIGRAAVGPSIKIINNILIIINNIGTVMAEVIIFGTATSNIVKFAREQAGITTDAQNPPWYLSFEFLTAIAALVMMPFVYVRSIERLKFVSLFAIVSIAIFASLSLADCIILYSRGEQTRGVSAFPHNFDYINAFAAFPALLLAMSFQFNMFPIYKATENCNDKRLLRVTISGMSGALTLYLLVAVTGYATYGQKLTSDYLDSFNYKQVGAPMYVILNVSFVLSTMFSFPIIFFGGRNNIISLISYIRVLIHNWRMKKRLEEHEAAQGDIFVKLKKDSSLNSFFDEAQNQNQNSSHSVQKEQFNPSIQGVAFYVLVTVCYVAVVVVAIVVRDLGPIFNILGAVSANALAFILPSVYYLRLTTQRFTVHYIASWVIIVISAALGIFCIVAQQIKSYGR